MPFLPKVSDLLQKIFQGSEDTISLAIQKIQVDTVAFEVALLAFKQDLLYYFKECVTYNLNTWDFYLTDLSASSETQEKIFNRNVDFTKTELKKQYQQNKMIQEQLLSFLAQLNQKSIKKVEDSDQISTLYQVVINLWDSSKNLKDVRDRVEDWQWSDSEELKKDYDMQRKMVFEFYSGVLHVLANLDNKEMIEMLHDLLDKIENNDKKYLRMVKKAEEDIEMVNLIQVSRYFSASCLAIVDAIDRITFTAEEKKYLKEEIKRLF